ncbi:CAP domain-containing protein [Rubrobacter taiwanensis]|uniref:CAP domain-containing protein n=1 Tax=Rubrobacter taiwanensis TaxID=185139 RepID=A0A4R1BSE9_9ACTN|nr:CAP domain-containing protein [Rubrobacter taiwanensis]TCJ20307.1 CAP domain-containing protein [Rubrobacter taiwanensis]
MKYALIFLTAAATSLAAFGAASLTGPEPAQAASGKQVRTCGGGTMILNNAEHRMLVLHNQARRNHGLRPLCIHPRLQRAARYHSRDMIQNNYFSHTSRNGQSFQQRLKRFGYPPNSCRASGVGENIAWGRGQQGWPGPIFQNWMNSSGHRANILARQFRHVGIGVAGGTYRGMNNVRMYTVDFGYCRR